ncbi:hypothetical protein NDU88_005759 [Pleurodeles waltl]|uniref:Uncharacterized protein n=1 Tax=Pleurodeles waltl TaxID=8319 RepID=A0AAV7WZK6_PLEWA|nr:hypothetical protein NDU88_005759 [Pleurodeles waltl]
MEMAGLGNPDIRVSQGVEKEEGQRARGEEKKDRAVGEDGDADGRDSAGKNIPDDEDGILDKQLLSQPRGDPPEGQGSPEQWRLRHVPGGAWLKQHKACSFYAVITSAEEFHYYSVLEMPDNIHACEEGIHFKKLPMKMENE